MSISVDEDRSLHYSLRGKVCQLHQPLFKCVSLENIVIVVHFSSYGTLSHFLAILKGVILYLMIPSDMDHFVVVLMY